MIKAFFSKNWITLAFAVAGGIGGFFYWKYVGCLNGCTITSVWYNSSAYGAIMGGLAGNGMGDWINSKRTGSSDPKE